MDYCGSYVNSTTASLVSLVNFESTHHSGKPSNFTDNAHAQESFFQHFYFLNDHWALQSRCMMHSIERQTSTISCKYTYIREQMRCKIVSLLPLIPNQTWNRARITTNQHQIKYKVLECTCTRLWHNFLYLVVNKSNSTIISKYLDRETDKFAWNLLFGCIRH